MTDLAEITQDAQKQPRRRLIPTPPAVYMAARYSRRLEAAAVMTALQEIDPGIESTARWLRGNHQIDDAGLSADASAAERLRFAEEDWEDVARADWLILLTEPPRSAPSRGGRLVEFGAALALNKSVYVIGPAENVFCCLERVKRFDGLTAFLNAIRPELPLRHCRHCRGTGRWWDGDAGLYLGSNRICMFCAGTGIDPDDLPDAARHTEDAV